MSSILPAEQWLRNQYALIFAVFVSFVGFAFVMPFLPLYVQELGVTNTQEAALWSGVLFAASPLLAATLAPLWGMIGDRYGYKIMLQRSLIAFVVLLFLMGLVRNVTELLILRLVLGFFGGFAALSMAFISTSSPPGQLSKSIGLMQSAQILSVAAGPLVGGFTADTLGIRNSFYVASALSLVALIPITFMLKEERRQAVAGSDGKRSLGFLDIFRVQNFLPLAAVLFIGQFIDKSFGPLLPLFVKELGTPASSAASMSGIILGLGAAAGALSAYLFGRMATGRSAKRLLLLSLVGGAVLVIPIAFVDTSLQLLALRVALGLMAGGTLTLGFTIGGKVIPIEIRGAAFGVLSSASMFGNAISPLASGGLAATGLRTMFLVDGILYLLIFVWIALAVPRSLEARRPTTPVAARTPETPQAGPPLGE